jgi:hypothetical protein
MPLEHLKNLLPGQSHSVSDLYTNPSSVTSALKATFAAPQRLPLMTNS